MSHFEYKGYLGSAEVDLESGALVGRLLYITDTITYSANSVKELKAAFVEAVDDYLATCQEMGDSPDLPCKGTFNVRIGPALHIRAALAARTEGGSLNDWVKGAIELRLEANGLKAKRVEVTQVRGLRRLEVEEMSSKTTEWQQVEYQEVMH